MLRKIIRNLRGLAVFSANTLNTVICFVPIMLLALLKFVVPVQNFRNLMSDWIMSVGAAWVAYNGRIFSILNDTEWDVRGLQELSKDRWYLVISNHQTWVDIVVLQTVLNRRIPFLKFFIKQELIWFPFLGLAWWAMDMPFMKRYSKSYLARYPKKKGKDLEATRIACQKFRDTPTTVINFVEGTRFSEEKKRRRAAEYDNLLPPRAGGIALALSSMGEMFDAILDVTIVYPRGVPQFWAMVCGEFDHVIVDIVKRPIDRSLCEGDYASDREFRREFHQWLAELWKEKDQKIHDLGKSGVN